MKQKSNLKNIGYTLISQIVILGLALVVPRFILTGYGSDTNGLLSTVAQIIAYMAMLEAGIGQAARNELYRYIHGDVFDKKNISSVMSVSRRSYRNITKIYAIFVILFAVILPFVIKTDLDYLTVFLVILIEGASGVVSFFFVQNWTNLLAVDGKQYINSNVDMINKVLIYTIKIVMAILGVNIIFMEIGFFAATVIKLIIYRKYMASHYGWVDYKADTAGRSLKDRRSYIVTEVAWTVFSSTDLIVISIFCSTKSASVYSIYYLVFMSINKLLDAVFTSLKFNLGQTFHKDKEQYKITHDLFNSVFIGTLTALMAVAYYLCIPFVSLYTKGVNDINYIDKVLPMCFSLILLFSWFRMVAEHLNGVAGYAKQLSRVSLVEVGINIVLSVAFVLITGSIRGVLYATVIALPVKIVFCNVLADKMILKRSAVKTVLIISVNLLLFLALAFAKEYIDIKITSYGEFALYGLLFTAGSVLLFLAANILVNKNILVYMKRFIKGKKS